MTNNLPAFKRQIEMLSIFYPYNKIKDCSVLDLAEKYRVAEVTISRDMKDLRSMGIPINSVYGKGIEITGKVDYNTVANLIIKYIAMYHSDVVIQDTLMNAVRDNNINYVIVFSTLNNAVESNNIILLKYKLSEDNILDVLVLPNKIIYNNNELELIGVNNNTVQTFKFRNIISVRITSEKDLNNYDSKIKSFMDKYGSTPSSKLTLKLQMENSTILERNRIFNFKITKKTDGDTVEAEVNLDSLDNLAKWVIEQYGQVKVLEPKELRDRIIELAQYTLNIYDDKSHTEESKYNPELSSAKHKKQSLIKQNNSKGMKESSVKLLGKEPLTSKRRIASGRDSTDKKNRYERITKDMLELANESSSENLNTVALPLEYLSNQLNEDVTINSFELELPLEALNFFSKQ